MFEAKINKNENKIEIFNVSEFDFSRIKLSNPIDVKPKEYDPKLKDLGLNSLIPTDDGEDFIFTFVSTNFLEDKFYTPQTLIGRRYTELFPFAKNSVEWYKKVYETGKKETIYIYFYENDSLVSCLEHKIVLWDDELVIFMEDKSDLIQVKSQKSPFEASSLPKILVKEDNTVKVNKAYEALVNARERNIDEFTLEDLDNNEILYNDLNLELSVSDIIKKLFNGEHYQIGYNMNMLTSKNKYSVVHGIARIINYDGEHAVEFIILKELLGDELELTLASDMNFDTIQEFTKSGFLYYNIKNNTFSWGKGIEDILEGPVPLDFNLIDVLDEITINNDVFKSGLSIDDISVDNPQIKTDYKIKTFKGNVKYINCVIKGIIEDDELTKLLYFFRDITDEVLRNYDLLSLRDTINDVETATSIGISYEDAEGKHHWTPGFYDIIERDPRDEDKYKNLFKDYMDSNDFNRIEELVKNLEPNEYLGDQIVPIHLDNDKTKYIKLNLRKIYDNKGNFVRISESTMDVTDEVLRNREIAELNATVEDVQSATSIGIHYVTPDGKYHWTPEYYHIIGRDPRPEDENRNILFDLFSPEDKKRLHKLITDLEPNKFLGGIVVPITLESGEKKYVKLNSHKIYDDNGNFVRRTGYTRDITNEVLNNQELLALRDTVEDVQEAASLGIHYFSPDGKYHWTSEYYNILEREPRDEDKYTHIVFDLLSDEDHDELNGLINDLKPNELLGNIVKPITLENGKKKYISFNARKIYDDEGRFIRKIGYTQDITNEVLRNRELTELSNTVNEVQAAASLGIHYVTPDGKYHWTPEYYNILERKPKAEDVNHNILFDLLNPDDRKELDEAIDNLEPNELLGNKIKQITLENGKTKYISFNIRKIYDDEGNFIRKIGYASDITHDVLRNQELIELNDTVREVQESTSLGIHYVTPDGKYHWTPEYYNILERDSRRDDKYHHIVLDLLEDEDRVEINKAMDNLEPNELLADIVKPVPLDNGKTKYIQFNGRKIYDDEGNFIRKIGYAKDVTEDILKDQELFDLRETVKDVQAAIAIGIHYLTPDGKYHWTPEYYNILEREPRDDDKDTHIVFDLLSDEDREEVEWLIDNLKVNEFLGNIVKPITLENGKIKHININGRKIYDKNGKFIRKSGCIQDVSSVVDFENKIMKADYEKTVLIKEVHHRVKNNLQTISSFISLEKRYGTNLDSIIEKTQNRIQVLALIHESIYADTDMKRVSIQNFIEQFDELLKSIALDSNISFTNKIRDLNWNMDEITPIVLIINELTSNSFKHAFIPGKPAEIYKSINNFEKDGKEYYRFHYKDNGPGMPDDFDIESTTSLGWSIIKALSAQLDGEYKLFNKDGFNFVLEFPPINNEYNREI